MIRRNSCCVMGSSAGKVQDLPPAVSAETDDESRHISDLELGRHHTVPMWLHFDLQYYGSCSTGVGIEFATVHWALAYYRMEAVTRDVSACVGVGIAHQRGEPSHNYHHRQEPLCHEGPVGIETNEGGNN